MSERAASKVREAVPDVEFDYVPDPDGEARLRMAIRRLVRKVVHAEADGDAERVPVTSGSVQ